MILGRHSAGRCTVVLGCELKQQESMNLLNRFVFVLLLEWIAASPVLATYDASATMSLGFVPLECNKESMLLHTTCWSTTAISLSRCQILGTLHHHVLL